MYTAKAYAKINWSLSITATRPDGYHDLDMLMQRISLHDVLSFQESDSVSLTVNGVPQPTDSSDLVLKAARALIAYTGNTRGAEIRLEKHIPARAGLAGGSADCAVALHMLNRMWALGLSREQLEAIGLKLGADVPFCVRNCYCRAQGIGEILTDLPSAPQAWLAIVTPEPGLSTPEVFREWNKGYPTRSVDTQTLANALAIGDYETAQSLSFNDLEAPAIALLPEVGSCITAFKSMGAKFVRMSGSGSTVFAVFNNENSARCAAAQVPGAIVAQTLGFTDLL